MTKTFSVKLKPELTPLPNSYVVVTCPKCGKNTYGVTGQKGKKCPVCRCQFPMPVGDAAPRFKTPEEACRFIQAEEAKRAGRMDFAPVTSGFRPAACAPVIARTSKVVNETKSLDAQFARWARNYFYSNSSYGRTGIPTATVVAAATKAGFWSADKLVQKAIAGGVLMRPKTYSVWFHELNNFSKDE
jgi:hypothetical protein